MSKAKQSFPEKATIAGPKTVRLIWGMTPRQWLWLAVVLAGTFLAYLPLLKAQFINYDDGLYVLQNPFIRNLNGAHLKALFTTIYQNQYSPAAMLIMALEVKFFGAWAPALKTVSILFHMLNTVLVFQLVHQLFKRFDYAIVTAALFALNTQQVEAVAWLGASMKIGAYAFFFLSSLLAYIRYLKHKRLGWLVFSAVLFLCACGSKEQAVALPASLLAIDYLYGRPLLNRAVILEKIPFCVISIGFALFTLSLTGRMQNREMVLYYTPLERAVFGSFALSSYIFKLILPVKLSSFYTYPIRDAIPAYYYATPIVGVLILGALVVCWKKKLRLVVFGIVFFLANVFLPLVSQALSVRDVMMADRFIYVPAAGFFLVVAYVLGEVLRNKPQLQTMVWTGLHVYAALLAVLTFQRAQVWETSVTLFTDVIKKEQQAAGKYNSFLVLAFNNRGVARKAVGDREGALADFEQALAIAPKDPRPWLNRANLHFDAGRYDAALHDYNKSLALDEKNAEGHCSRGATYAAQNKFDLALKDFNRAIELDPMMIDAYGNRSLLYSGTKHFAEELADVDRYLQLKPDDADMINMRALALIDLKRLPEAEAELNRAIRMNPTNGAFYLNRSSLYHSTGRKAQALEDAQRAQSLGTAVDQQYLNGLHQAKE